MTEDERIDLYLRDIQSMVPPDRGVTDQAARRQRMVRFLREWMVECHPGVAAARA